MQMPESENCENIAAFSHGGFQMMFSLCENDVAFGE